MSYARQIGDPFGRAALLLELFGQYDLAAIAEEVENAITRLEDPDDRDTMIRNFAEAYAVAGAIERAIFLAGTIGGNEERHLAELAIRDIALKNRVRAGDQEAILQWHPSALIPHAILLGDPELMSIIIQRFMRIADESACEEYKLCDMAASVLRHCSERGILELPDQVTGPLSTILALE